MSAARLSHPAPVLMHAQRGGESAPTPAKMSFYDLQNLFWQLYASERFSGTETCLYFYWLNRLNAGLNGEYWPAEYPRWSKQVEADLGLTDKTLAKARTVLVKRGLLSYREGSKSRAAVWGLGKIARNNSDQSDEIAPHMSRKDSDQSGTITPHMSRNNSGLYKEKTKDLNNDKDKDPAASAAGGGEGELEELASPPESPADASHTEGGAVDVATSKPQPVGPRSWVYDPAAVAENLRLPFASAEFRAAWVRYRTYREEMKFRRLSGGMMEQQQLDSLAQLASGSEAHALLLIDQAIRKGWQDFYPLDKPYATAQQPATLGRRPAGAGRVETLPTYGRNRGPQAPPPASSAAGSAA
jgi:hypothetical protein